MMPLQRVNHEAMATEFSIVFADPALDPTRAAGLARLVFDEIDRMEDELSRFKSISDIWRINGLRTGQSTTVDFATLDCLQLAQSVHAETNGAFDITIGPLMQCWRNQDGSPRTPSEEELQSVCSRLGMHLVEIFAHDLKVGVKADYLQLDLGAIGKGYALDQAVRLLEENEVSGALLSAGESTLLVHGQPPHADGWPINLDTAEPQLLLLKEGALSCSGFDVKGNHLMNPRTGHPVEVADRRSYVQAPTAALSDAVSTAFMVMEHTEIEAFLGRFPELKRWG
jgi:thiamine biosynthesis lipoprotein